MCLPHLNSRGQHWHFNFTRQLNKDGEDWNVGYPVICMQMFLFFRVLIYFSAYWTLEYLPYAAIIQTTLLNIQLAFMSHADSILPYQFSIMHSWGPVGDWGILDKGVCKSFSLAQQQTPAPRQLTCRRAKPEAAGADPRSELTTYHHHRFIMACCLSLIEPKWSSYTSMRHPQNTQRERGWLGDVHPVCVICACCGMFSEGLAETCRGICIAVTGADWQPVGLLFLSVPTSSSAGIRWVLECSDRKSVSSGLPLLCPSGAYALLERISGKEFVYAPESKVRCMRYLHTPLLSTRKCVKM